MDSDQWRYLVPQSEPDAAWIELSYNDSSWEEGVGGFGYGDDDDGTELESAISAFQRLIFSIDDTSKVMHLVTDIDYDDGFVAYLNGQEIGRSQMGASGTRPDFDRWADDNHEASLYQGLAPDARLLFNKENFPGLVFQGDNILAIQTHNVNDTSSDMSSRAFVSLAISDDSRTYRNVPAWFSSPIVGPFFFSSHLPLIVIDTGGQTILREPKITASMKVINKPGGQVNTTDDTPNDFNGQVGIEVRGSSSSGFPKKNYSFETRRPDGSDVDVSLLGFPEEEDWVLHGPYSDKSLIRNVMLYELSRRMGRWAPRTKLLELILDGEYQGVYAAMERIKRDSLRVDIAKLKKTDVEGDELTGGYIVKIEGGRDPGWQSAHQTPSGRTIIWSWYYPKLRDIEPAQDSYIRGEIAAFEASVAGEDIANPETGYPAHIDIDSAVDFYILNEVSRNVDGYRLSTFMHKTKDSEGNGKLIWGPVWDFNLGFGNADYYDGGNHVGYQATEGVPASDGAPPPFWVKKIWQDSTMNAAVVDRWRSLRQTTLHTDSLMQIVDDYVDEIGVAADRNFDRWRVLGSYVWPNNFVGNTYESEIEYLKGWIQNRVTWMDTSIDKVVPLPSTPGNSIYGYSLTPIYPNPSSKDQSLDIISQASQLITAEIFDSMGRLVRTVVRKVFERNVPNRIVLPSSQLPAGHYTLRVTARNTAEHRQFVVVK